MLTSRGCIDTVTQTHIHGWAVCELPLSVFINGSFAFTLVPDTIRNDVNKDQNLAPEIATGFTIPTNVIDSNVLTISIRFSDGVDLHNSPFNLPTKSTIKKCNKTNFLDCFTSTHNTFKIVRSFEDIDFTNISDILLLLQDLTITTRHIKDLQYTAYTNNSVAFAGLCDMSCIYIKSSVLKETRFTDINELIYFVYTKSQHGLICFTLPTLPINESNKPFTGFIYKQLCDFNYHIKRIKKSQNNKNRNILYLISTQDGGTPQTNQDLMYSLESDINCYLLRCDRKKLFLYEVKNKYTTLIEEVELNEPLKLVPHTSHDYDCYFIDILYRYNIDIVHIRHICWHSLTLYRATEYFNVPIVYSMHDFYAICPSHNLLDEHFKYCGGVCTSGGCGSSCNTVLWDKSDVPPLKHMYIDNWRAMFNSFFIKCDMFITTSKSTSDIYTSHYTSLANKIRIIEHGRDLNYINLHNDQIDQLNVIVPGTMSYAKGANVIKELKELDTGNLLNIIFVGEYFEPLSGIGTFTGRYERDNLQQVITTIRPHVALIPSIWPETFCHTLTEMWYCGIPTICFDMGAQGDRSLKINNTYTVKCVGELFLTLVNLYKTPPCSILKKDLGSLSGIEQMSLKYLEMYSYL